jgi:hypothetical protein
MRESNPMEYKEKMFQENGIYFVESAEDNSVLIAIDPSYSQENNTVQWFDTKKARLKKVANIMEISPEKITFQDSEGSTYSFQTMTFELFNEKVKDQMSNVGDYKNQKEMEEGLRKSYENVVSY